MNALSVEIRMLHPVDNSARDGAVAGGFRVPGEAGLRLYDPLSDAAWDQALASCPNASFFHTSAWARVLHESYGYRPRYFIAQHPQPFALAWMEVRSWLTGSRLVSLPFTDSCATNGVDSEAFRHALREISESNSGGPWKYWELRGGAELLPEVTPSTVFLNHQLRLEGREGEILARFQSTTRTAIRKAESAGVEVEISRDMAAVKIFYDLLCQTRKRHGTPPQPFAFFENIHRHVVQQSHGFVALARVGGRPAAGIVFLQHGATAIYKYAASDEQLQQFRASNLVLWRGIQHLLRQGVSLLDFGRTSLSNAGLQRFKRGWGSDERPLGYLRFDLRTRSYVTVNDQAAGWRAKLFRQVPDPLGKLIGRFLYRHSA